MFAKVLESKKKTGFFEREISILDLLFNCQKLFDLVCFQSGALYNRFCHKVHTLRRAQDNLYGYMTIFRFDYVCVDEMTVWY